MGKRTVKRTRCGRSSGRDADAGWTGCGRPHACACAARAPEPEPEPEPESDREKSQTKQKRSAAAAGEIPAGLLDLIDGWNTLGESIVAKRKSRPASAFQGCLERLESSNALPHHRTAFAERYVPAILTAIQSARFCHGQGWFSLPWLFGVNKNREFNIARLLAGAYNGDSKNGNGKKPVPDSPRPRRPDLCRVVIAPCQSAKSCQPR